MKHNKNELTTTTHTINRTHVREILMESLSFNQVYCRVSPRYDGGDDDALRWAGQDRTDDNVNPVCVTGQRCRRRREETACGRW